jgi:glutathione S-transferase
MRLYGYWTSNPQKIRLALEEIGQPYDYEDLDLSQRAHKTPEFKALNPRQKVPLLVDGDSVLWESGAALVYLSSKAPHLWPADEARAAQALSLLFFEASTFNEVARVYFFNRLVLPRLGKDGDEARVAQAAKKMKPLLTLLEERLSASNAYLLGDFTLVDCAYAPFLPVLDLAGFPSLQAWRHRLMARPSWGRADFSYGLYGPSNS